MAGHGPSLKWLASGIPGSVSADVLHAAGMARLLVSHENTNDVLYVRMDATPPEVSIPPQSLPFRSQHSDSPVNRIPYDQYHSL